MFWLETLSKMSAYSLVVATLTTDFVMQKECYFTADKFFCNSFAQMLALSGFLSS